MISDEKTCPECAETIKAAAKIFALSSKRKRLFLDHQNSCLNGLPLGSKSDASS